MMTRVMSRESHHRKEGYRARMHIIGIRSQRVVMLSLLLLQER